jgi:hypothetical protein
MMVDFEAVESRDAVVDAAEVVVADEDEEDNTSSNMEGTPVATFRLNKTARQIKGVLRYHNSRRKMETILCRGGDSAPNAWVLFFRTLFWIVHSGRPERRG